MDGDNGGLAAFSYSIRRKEKPVDERQNEPCRFGLRVFSSFPFRRSLPRPVMEFFCALALILIGSSRLTACLLSSPLGVVSVGGERETRNRRVRWTAFLGRLSLCFR